MRDGRQMCVGWEAAGVLVLIKFCLLVAPREGDAHPLGALPVGTLINNVESEPGRGAQYIRAAGRRTVAASSLTTWKARGYLRSQFSEPMGPLLVHWQRKRKKKKSKENENEEELVF